ncbi:MAG: alpha/beta hydrolase [Proteobacteria bacterium]|nr:alpha/beta hydrolase [Pseudomonadota bacterium]
MRACRLLLRWLLTIAWIGCAVAHAAPAFPPAADAAPMPDHLVVGTLTLARCGDAYCGDLPRPLDDAHDVPGTIPIHFEFHPQRDPQAPSAGHLVATEGGPGYPTTGSRAGYLRLYAALMGDRSLLLVDNRGTGRSAAIDCPLLQRDPQYRNATVGACGTQLGVRSDLYGTGAASDDLAAVIEALQLGPVDLYGDSYGSYFAQAFAVRHPSLLRSLVLDGAYPVRGADPWYPEIAAQANTAFNQACMRSPACGTQPGLSMDRIGALLAALRSAPVHGAAMDGDGRLLQVTADAPALAYLMTSNASGPVVYRDLDAAARAWLAGDQAPLLRLVAENRTSAYSANGAPEPAVFSAGLFAAVSCSDYPQVYDMHEPPARRWRSAQAAVAAKKQAEPMVYAPFSIDEYLAVPQDYSVVDLCVAWPAPADAHPPGQPVPPDAAFPALPVLVLSGDLDSLTPPAQGAQATALFPDAHQVIVANSFHVTAIGDEDDCAAAIVRRFVTSLSPGDTSCAARIAEVRLVPRFATRTAQLAPAEARPGNQGTPHDLREAAAAVLTAGDALARWWITTTYHGVGLRGGRFDYRPLDGATQFALKRLKWTADLPISGTMRRVAATHHIEADLVLPDGTLHAEWDDRVPLATATVSGTLGGRHVAATMYAP